MRAFLLLGRAVQNHGACQKSHALNRSASPFWPGFACPTLLIPPAQDEHSQSPAKVLQSEGTIHCSR